MRCITASAFFLLFLSKLIGQTPVGSWSDHLVYNYAQSVTVGSKTIFASTGSSILVYDKSLSQLSKLSRINGLTETGISAIAYSEENKTLVIGYNSMGIDLVVGNTVYNIPDIERKFIEGSKTIHKIRTNGRYAFAACSFGIVVIDLVKMEVYDTWYPSSVAAQPDVFDLTFGNGKIYAATGKGVYSGDLTNKGLSYSGNWNVVNYLPDPSGKYNLVLSTGNNLYVNLYDPFSGNDIIYKIAAGNSVLLTEPGIRFTSMEAGSSGFTVTSANTARLYNQDGILQKTISTYGWGYCNISAAVVDEADIWIADKNSGLVYGEKMAAFSTLALPGPASNNAWHISSVNGITVATGGGVNSSWNNLAKPFDVSVHGNNSWDALKSSTAFDPVRSAIDPDDPEHIFIATWGSGLLEYRNNVLQKQYTASNSPLQASSPGNVRVFGLAFDNTGNLWVTQSGVSNNIKVLKADGSWIVIPVKINAPVTGDIVIAQNGYKWINLPGNGLFVLDDNNTPDNITDDRSLKFLITDNNRKIVSNVFSLAVDLDGTIWAGTDQGPFIYFNPGRILDDELTAFRITVPRNDGTDLGDYMLGTEKITSISVDGANRKWLGTASSGVYLLSSDGTSMLKHFNEENSPLFSNSIESIAADNKTGDVWIGTTKGLISVRENATSGGESFSDLYAFPNPVRNDYSGNVTVTGLVRNTQVKITDVSGNLVYETTSDGGMATWDLNNYQGHRISTGVYIVFCSAPDGRHSAVTKILIIGK
jgi:hypothetical protein